MEYDEDVYNVPKAPVPVAAARNGGWPGHQVSKGLPDHQQTKSRPLVSTTRQVSFRQLGMDNNLEMVSLGGETPTLQRRGHQQQKRDHDGTTMPTAKMKSVESNDRLDLAKLKILRNRKDFTLKLDEVKHGWPSCCGVTVQSKAKVYKVANSFNKRFFTVNVNQPPNRGFCCSTPPTVMSVVDIFDNQILKITRPKRTCCLVPLVLNQQQFQHYVEVFYTYKGVELYLGKVKEKSRTRKPTFILIDEFHVPQLKVIGKASLKVFGAFGNPEFRVQTISDGQEVGTIDRRGTGARLNISKTSPGTGGEQTMALLMAAVLMIELIYFKIPEDDELEGHIDD